MQVAIINYGMGNLASVSRALQTLGYRPFIAELPTAIDSETCRLILPGVGAFGEAMARLRDGGWIGPIGDFVAKEPNRLLGICLGMQLLATRGTEGGDHEGLDLIPGEVLGLRAMGVSGRVPHVGWNEVRTARADLIMTGIPDDTDFYFVHGFGYAVTDPKHLVAAASYGATIPAVINRANIWGAQFHPEKSSKAGLRLLRNFVDGTPC